jgi:predicted metallopeptidase
MAKKKRPNITRLVRAVIADAAQRLPEFAHVKSTRILVVVGEARRSSWATIRPLGSSSDRRRPVVRIKGRQMLYVITLRPRFLRVATPEKRVETILHELFHISTRFDGTLHGARRHGQLGPRFAAKLGPLVRRYWHEMPAELREGLSMSGLAVARQWLEKPGPTAKKGTRLSGRRLYTEKHLFLGPVQVLTRGQARKGEAVRAAR